MSLVSRYIRLLDTNVYDICSKAQLIGFILVANKEDRGIYAMMFNDEIMILYLVLTLYYAIKNKPILASFFFTLGLSVKAGFILLLPAFLGQLQLNYGTI